MNKLDGESLNIANENITKLKELFPEVFSEGKIDFEKLQNELGKFVDKENERYNFTWYNVLLCQDHLTKYSYSTNL